MADAHIKPGTYRIENEGFSEDKKRVLDLKGSGTAAGTPIICYPDNGTDAQKWQVTEFDGGYNFQAVVTPSNIFISSIGPGEQVTGTPYQKTAFKLRNAGGGNRYQIIATENDQTYAFQAPDASSDTITLRQLVASNPRQIWRFANLN